MQEVCTEEEQTSENDEDGIPPIQERLAACGRIRASDPGRFEAIKSVIDTRQITR